MSKIIKKGECIDKKSVPSVPDEVTAMLIQLRQIEQRVNQLELSNDTTQTNMSVIRELVDMLKEVPVGKTIVNRAINRSKLRYLLNVVLPRRTKQLVDLQKESMPAPIRKEFMNHELKLLQNTTRSIAHRRKFEKQAEVNVKTFFTRLFRLRIPKLLFTSTKGGI